MTGKDWGSMGRDLNRIIEDAVRMGNFGRLNEDINSTLRRAFGGFSQSGDFNRRGWDFDLSGNAAEDEYTETTEHGYEAADRGGYKAYGAKPVKSAAVMGAAAYITGKGRRTGGAVGLIAGGTVLIMCCWVPFAAMLPGMILGADTAAIGGAAAALIGAAGLALIAKGIGQIRLSRRLDTYIRCMKGKYYEDIKVFAAYSHQTPEKVRKDIKKMISRGWFIQGHMDEKQTCFMINDETYAQYLDTVKNIEIQKEEEKKKTQEKTDAAGNLSPQAKEILKQGQMYIEQIRKSNDAIPGEEISEKIYNIELLTSRIFEQAREHPETISDLRKLMDYYLPMTVKLLKAYEELDGQPVQGENITNSKREIEKTLDTLNVAFEKLLDNLFRDRAWDVSSDISVLETMLAQEGLTEDGISSGRKK